MTLETATRYENRVIDIDPIATYKHDFSAMQKQVERPLEERVKWIRNEGEYSFYQVDGTIEVKTLSKTACKAIADQWDQSRKEKAVTLDWVMRGGVISYWGGIFIGQTELGAAGMVVAAVIVVAGAILAGDVAEQVDKWHNSQVNYVAQIRTKAYQEGFTKVPKAVLHSEEIHDFYNRSHS